MSELLTRHWVIGGLLASLLWFLAGQQSLSNKKPDNAIAFQRVAVFLIVALCAWSVVEGEWLGLVCGLAVLYFEIRSIRRILAIQTNR